MKVMIAFPPLEGKGSPMLTQNRQFQWYNVGSYIFPVVPAYAASLLKSHGHRVTWEDSIAAQRSSEAFWRRLLRVAPDVIAMESKTPVIRQHWAIADRIKAELPDCKVVLMGDHVTALPEETMESCRADYAITGGDYDFSLLSIVQALAGEGPLAPGICYRDGEEIKRAEGRVQRPDLDALPFIDRTLTEAHRYGEKWRKREQLFYTMAGRDCPWGKCTFCSWTTIHPRFNCMSVERALDEIGHLIEHYGAEEVFDDSGTIPGGAWLRNFCRGMIDRGYNKRILISSNVRFDYFRDPEAARMMKRAGWRKVKAGLESANQKTLDRIAKGTSVDDIVTGCRNASEAGIDVHLTVMVGFPWETKQDAEQTLELAKGLMSRGHAEMLQSTVVVPYPGTPLYREALEHGWLTCAPDDYERFDMRGSVLKTPNMSSDDIVKTCNAIYRAHFTPRYMVRQAIRNLGDPSYLFRGAKAMVGHLLDFGRDS